MTNPSPITLDRAKIEAIKAGTEGVTPGPWFVASDHPALAIGAESGHRIVQTENQNNYRHFGASQPWHGIGSYTNAKHIARLDPATVSALCDLALEALSHTAPSGSDMVLVPRADLDTITLNVNHALMVLPTPNGASEKRAWSSLIDAKNVLEALAATQPQGDEQ